ncbi:MAG: hypothetical protein RR967_06975, partial [Anaerovoracaceae bacterium]
LQQQKGYENPILQKFISFCWSLPQAAPANSTNPATPRPTPPTQKFFPHQNPRISTLIKDRPNRIVLKNNSVL